MTESVKSGRSDLIDQWLLCAQADSGKRISGDLLRPFPAYYQIPGLEIIAGAVFVNPGPDLWDIRRDRSQQ